MPEKYWTGVLDHIKNSPRVISHEENGQAAASPVQEFRVDDPNELNHYSDWSVGFRQIEAGKLDTRMIIRQSEHVSLLEIHMDRGIHQIGCSPNDAVTVGIPFTPTLRSWHGARVETPVLVNFGTAKEFDGVSDSGFSALTISVSEPFITRVADQIGLSHQDELRAEGSLPLNRKSEAIERLTSSGRRLLNDSGTRFGESEQEDFVARLILAMTDAETLEDRSTHVTRAMSVRRALAYFIDRAGDGVSIGDICDSTGVSWRTLDRGFREQFGIGPKAYLNRYRLGRVRADLLRLPPDTVIADVANDWGFWHMGQFAKDYRGMFGELPSDTLRSRRQ